MTLDEAIQHAQEIADKGCDQCAKEHPEYDEEVWSEELTYPYEYNYDDVRILQWPGGHHWYAKIGSMDIVDKYGNQKWSDKSYAIEIAKRFCKCGGDWSKEQE